MPNPLEALKTGLGRRIAKQIPGIGDLMALPEIYQAGQEAERTGDVGQYAKKMLTELSPVPMRMADESPISQNPLFRRMGKQFAEDPQSLMPEQALFRTLLGQVRR